ncbi:PKD domain-containing protein [Bacteroidota bacterium]
MKQLIVAILIFTSLGVTAQKTYDLIITGKVRNIKNGMAVTNQLVTVESDTINFPTFFYHNQVITDNNGVYIDTIVINFSLSGGLVISTYDCLNNPHDTNIFYSQYNSVVIANFNICDSLANGTCQSLFGYFPINMMAYSYQFVDYSSGKIAYRLWEFGDGSSSQMHLNPIHVYQNPGKYNVCYTVIDFNNCQNTYCDTVTIDTMTIQCDADFSYYLDTLINTPNYFHFFDNSTGNNIISWSWDFGDGYQSAQKNPQHQFITGGTFQVCLKIVAFNINTGLSCIDSVCKTLIVSNPSHYTLGGQIFAGNYPINYGNAYLYYKVGYDFFPLDTTYFDTYGYYYFQSIPQSNYIVKVETTKDDPYNGQYYPTYFGNNLFWEQASLINLNCNIWQSGVNLIPIPGAPLGVGTIIGKVIHFENNPPWDKKPVPFADVYLLDTGHNPFDYIKSDANGYFTFSGLGYRSYYLTADVTGKCVQTKFVTLDSIYSISDTVFLVVEECSTVGINDLDASSQIKMEVYPNPAHDNINILFSKTFSGIYEFEIMNLLGQVVYHDQIMHIDENTIITLDLNDLPSGIFLLTAKSINGNRTQSLKFIKR